MVEMFSGQKNIPNCSLNYERFGNTEQEKDTFHGKKRVRPIIEVSKWFLNMNSLEYLEKDNFKKRCACTHIHTNVQFMMFRS